MTAALRTVALSVRYGGVEALTACDLEVGHGQLVGLIGPNGAGKTTFIDAVTGFARSTGTVEIDGRDISRLAPHKRAAAGFARTWQAAELFDELTVRENLAIGAGGYHWRETAGDVVRGRASIPSAVDETIELLGLGDLADRQPDSLTHGQRKVVGVGRALAAKPKVVLLDEPAAGLDTSESQALGAELRRVCDHGLSLLLVDHDMALVLSVCDYVIVLEFGKIIASGPPDKIRGDARVIDAYLGETPA
jgi:branched-chain amino acid transport system ATP-binding protein